MSKLNPQKATAYVGPGVLRKGGKITKVPNGPLIKKKGPFKGSTLKTGGRIKKAQNSEILNKRDSIVNVAKQKKADALAAQLKAINDRKEVRKADAPRKLALEQESYERRSKESGKSIAELKANDSILKIKTAKEAKKEITKPTKKLKKQGSDKPSKCAVNLKSGGMIKRADGSMSRRGLWDNIRKNKGSGKKPTKQMLVQEKKIKAKTKK